MKTLAEIVVEVTPESTITAIETTYKCPICGTELVLYEDDAGGVSLGCERCELYVPMSKIARKYWSALFAQPARRLVLREFLDRLYKSFVEAVIE